MQLALIDAARQEEALTTQEQRLKAELGTIPAHEQNLTASLAELEEGRARIRRQESVLREWERRLSEKGAEVSSQEMALADWAWELSHWEEAAQWEAATAGTVGERVVAAQREARAAAAAAALDATAKIKDTRAGFDSQLCEADS